MNSKPSSLDLTLPELQASLHQHRNRVKSILDSLAQEIQPQLFASYSADFHLRGISTPASEIPQIAYQGVYLAELLRLASNLAIDIGMNKTVFTKAAEEAYDVNESQAPRFG